jgi:hypothetical protein
MFTYTFAQKYDTTKLSSLALERHLFSYIVGAANHENAHNSTNCLHWNFQLTEKSERRLMIVFEKNNPEIKVFIEATYELFAGDIHYCVEQIGTVWRSEITKELAPVIEKACQHLLVWKPSHANIWN